MSCRQRRAEHVLRTTGKMGRVIGENLLGPEPTLLPAEPDVLEALASTPAEDVVRQHPDSSLVWAVLAEKANAESRELESYAFARVGYHRGLDSLRRAGWRGAGPIPWAHEPNRGVLRALYALRRAADAIGETAEVERLTDFLNEADENAIDQIEGRS